MKMPPAHVNLCAEHLKLGRIPCGLMLLEWVAAVFVLFTLAKRQPDEDLAARDAFEMLDEFDALFVREMFENVNEENNIKRFVRQGADVFKGVGVDKFYGLGLVGEM